jgi:hypothetical protein
LPYINKDAEKLWVRALGDKLLIDGKIRFMLFFESDEPFRGGPAFRPYQLFPTRNGFHVVGYDLAFADEKLEWFRAWKAMYPKSDYLLGSWCFLRPVTKREAAFILSRSPVVPKTCKYYRDKACFERFDEAGLVL